MHSFGSRGVARIAPRVTLLRLAISLFAVIAGAIAPGCDQRPRGEFDLAPKIIGTWEGPTDGLTLRVNPRVLRREF